MRQQEFFHFKGSLASGSCSSDSLPEARILDVPGRKHSLNICPAGLTGSDYVAKLIGVNKLLEYIGIRMMADCKEKSVNTDIKNLTILTDQSGSGNS